MKLKLFIILFISCFLNPKALAFEYNLFSEDCISAKIENLNFTDLVKNLKSNVYMNNGCIEFSVPTNELIKYNIPAINFENIGDFDLVYQNSVLIGETDYYNNSNFHSQRVSRTYRLNPDQTDYLVTIKIKYKKSLFSGVGLINEPEIGDLSTLNKKAFVQNFFNIYLLVITSTILIFFSAIVIGLFYYHPSGKMFLAFGLSSFGFGIFSFCLSRFPYYVLGNTFFWLKISWVAALVALLNLFIFLKEYFQIRTGIIRYLFIVNSILVIYYSTVVDLKVGNKIYGYWLFLIVFYLVYFEFKIISSIRKSTNLKSGSKFILIFYTIYVLLALNDIFRFLGIFKSPNLNSFGVFFLMAVIFYNIVLEVIDLYNKSALAEKLKVENLELSYQVKTVNMAKQVAHDIRSPLSALNIITSTLADVPEEKRLLIRNSVQRINDIANDLLQKGRATSCTATIENLKTNKIHLHGLSDLNKIEPPQESQKCYVFLLSTVVDNVVSEKRIQYREKINININIDLKDSFGLFVNANPNELSRVISNLINNSVESLPNNSGNVDVIVFNGHDKKVIIQVKDNGSGIPKHVLVKLGQQGVSYGKRNTQSGSGLGVYHAINTVKEFGGQITFQSVTADDLKNNETNKNLNLSTSAGLNSRIKTGTTITIELPSATRPEWFADSIQLNAGQEFVTVDDDISIHQIWKGRLESLKATEHKIKITSFTSANDFRNYFKSMYSDQFNTSAKYLIDYEFINQNDNGLRIIIDLGIQDKSILVTSRFDEPNIRSECETYKIKILPKQLAGQINIVITHNIDAKSIFQNTELIDRNIDSKTENIHQPLPPSFTCLPNYEKLSKYDLCLIDDDKHLVHSIWGMVAKEKGLNIKMFERPEDFMKESSGIDKLTPIYVDVSLANNINGIEVAKSIHEQGFENINLATGYDSDSIKVPHFIRNVVGKDFPTLE